MKEKSNAYFMKHHVYCMFIIRW